MSRNIDAVIGYYEYLIKLKPDRSSYYSKLSKIYLRRGNLPKAIIYKLMEAEILQSFPAKSLKAYEEAFNLDRTNKKVYNKMLEISKSIGLKCSLEGKLENPKFSEKEKTYEEILELARSTTCKKMVSSMRFNVYFRSR